MSAFSGSSRSLTISFCTTACISAALLALDLFCRACAPFSTPTMIEEPVTPPASSAAAASAIRFKFSGESKASPSGCSPNTRSLPIWTNSCAPPVAVSSAPSLAIRLRTPSVISFPVSLASCRLSIPPTGPARSSVPDTKAVIVVTSLVASKYSSIACACSSGGKPAVTSCIYPNLLPIVSLSAKVLPTVIAPTGPATTLDATTGAS